MKSIVSCTAVDASGGRSSIIFNIAATCFSSSDWEDKEEEEEEEVSGECAVPARRDG